MQQTHYVYVSFRRATRQFYIGFRSATGPDDGYLGSGRWPRSLRGQHVLEKEILKVCPTRQAARVLEKRLINAFRSHPLCMNDRRDDRILPDPPEGVTWPPQFHNSELWRKRAGLRIYLETYWLPFIERSLVDMRFLRAYYPTTVTAIYGYKTARSDEGRARRDLPKHLRILHESEDLRLALRKEELPPDLDRRRARPTQQLAA